MLMRSFMAWIAIVPGLITSALICYSVLVFGPLEMHKDQSRYRLARYAKTTPQDVVARRESYTKMHISGSDIPVVNARPIESNRYQGVLDAPAFVEFPVEVAKKDIGYEVITKVTLRLPARHLIDQRTVHWLSNHMTEYSDNVYYKFPISSLVKEQELWIDGDVTRLRVLVTGRRGSPFSTEEVIIEKFIVPAT